MWVTVLIVLLFHVVASTGDLSFTRPGFTALGHPSSFEIGINQPRICSRLAVIFSSLCPARHPVCHVCLITGTTHGVFVLEHQEPSSQQSGVSWRRSCLPLDSNGLLVHDRLTSCLTVVALPLWWLYVQSLVPSDSAANFCTSPRLPV